MKVLRVIRDGLKPEDKVIVNLDCSAPPRFSRRQS